MENMLVPNNDSTIVARNEKLTEAILEDKNVVKPNWIRSKKFTVIPTESIWNTTDDIVSLLEGLKSLKIHSFIAIALEAVNSINVHGSYRIENSLEGLEVFIRNCGGFKFLLTTENQSFAILCSSDGYYIIVGTTQFIKKVSGGDIKKAVKDYKEYCAGENIDVLRKTLEMPLTIYEII
ncbi:MAG: hypothetical protein ACRBF0_11455 [Calditrichia bacterium]